MSIENETRTPFSLSSYAQSAATAAIAMCLLSWPCTASAQAALQPAPTEGLADIVVTATRNSESSQKVPISLTAIGADSLAKSGITSALQLPQLAPSMYVLGTISEGSPRYSIRGISNSDTLPSASSAVATYVDDVFQASQFGISTGLFDLQRVEVLRGPQGTTFGKNTTGGAVAYFSQVPTNTFSGYVTARLAGGNRPQRFAQGAVNVPLVDQTLALRFSFNIDSKGNYVKDPTNPGQRGNGWSQAYRLQARWTPSDSTTVNLTGFYTRLRNDGALAHADFGPGNTFGLAPNTLSIDTVTETPLQNLHDNFVNKGGTLRIEQSLGDFQLTAISHYRRTAYQKGIDVEGRVEDAISYFSHSLAEQYGQEVRLASDPTKPLSGLLGGYFEKDKVRDVGGIGATTPTAIFGEYNNHSYQLTHTTTYAVFGNLKYNFTDQLSATGGIRKTWEKRTQDALLDYFQDRTFDWTVYNLDYEGAAPTTPTQSLPYNLSLKARPITWDVTLDYKPTNAVLLFTRVAKGYRSGGFNPGGVALFPFQLPQPVPLPFGGESIQSYEIGVKTSWFDHRLRINAGAFHYNFDNQQVVIAGPGGIPTTSNAGKSKVDGGEVEITVTPVKRLELSVNASYTNPKYKEYLSPTGDYSGNRLIQAPKWTLNGSANWTTPISADYDFAADTFWSYRSDLFFTPDNSAAFRASPVAIGNFRVGIQSASKTGFSVNAFVNNVTNKRPLAGGVSFGPNTNVKYFEPGRVFGVDVSYKW